jgi:hypothetical protein
MKRRILCWVAALAPAAVAAFGQVQTAPPTGQKTLAASIDVYVFPTAGQDAAQQSKDEAQCYTWAVQNTGSDPFQLAKRAEEIQREGQQAQAQASEAGKGTGVKGALGGAALGALIGEIASDDAGKGAAIGGTAGLIVGRRRAKEAQQKASSQAQAQTGQALAANEELMLGFRKAFSVCLEAKKYMVKF